MVRRIALTLALAWLVSGCGLLPAGPVVVTLSGPAGTRDLPVALYDPDGVVAAVEAAEFDFGSVDDKLTKTADDAVVLQWLGGACDTKSQINVLVLDRTLSVAVRTDVPFGSCTAAGIQRAVRIRFRDPIGDRTLEFAGSS